MRRTYLSEDEISALAESIAENGLLQPIVVKPENEEYVLIFGEKRLRAYSLLGRTTIEAVIVENKSPLEVLSIQLAENLHRSEPHIIDIADSVRKMWEVYHLNPDEISKSLSIKVKDVYRLFEISELSASEKELFKEMDMDFLKRYYSFKKRHEDDNEVEKFVTSCKSALTDLEKASPNSNTKENRVALITNIFENTNLILSILEKKE